MNEVARILHGFYPWLGQRRKARASEALAKVERATLPKSEEALTALTHASA